jgi:glycosyltransferase involved in cell wall biosynthesis
MQGISVIICCYNSATRIATTLAHLAKQEHLHTILWEIIVVDNASTDNTQEVVLQNWQNSIAPLHLLYEKNAGLANARACGFAAAKYDFFCMVDDDNWLESNYLATVFKIFVENPKIGACGGWGEAVFLPNTEVPFWYDRFKNGYAVGKMAETEKILSKEKEFLYGAGLAMRKIIWNNLENIGFKSMLLGRTGNKVTSGEDVEMNYMVQILGYDLFFSPKLHFKHLMANNRLTWEYLKKLKRGFGSSAIYHGFYKNVLYPTTFRTQIRRFWLGEFVLNLLILFAKFVLFFPFSLVDKEGSWRCASWQYSAGRVAEIWNLREDYQKINQKINQYRKN